MRNYFATIACKYMCLLPKSVIKKKLLLIIKNNIVIRIVGKVSQFIDASMNRTTPTMYACLCVCTVHACRRTCMRVTVFVWVYADMRVCKCANVCMHLRMCVSVHLWVYSVYDYTTRSYMYANNGMPNTVIISLVINSSLPSSPKQCAIYTGQLFW